MQILTPEVWIIIGFVCIILEFMIPGVLFVFFGISAIFVGLLTIMFGLPSGHGIPYLVFTILSVGQIVFLRKKFKSWFTGKTLTGDENTLEEYIGKEATVVSGFEGDSNKGTVQFKGANWNAVSNTAGLKPGDEVIIEKQSGITLTVSKNA